VLPFRAKNSARGLKRQVAWLTIAALMWSSGQGAMVSAVFQLAGLNTGNSWHCVMLGGGAHDSHGAMPSDMPMDSDMPVDDGSGYCPVCSLTGCSASNVVATTEYQYSPPIFGFSKAQRVAAEAPRYVALFGRPQARAPPLSV
jgi:hypothetical protein